MDSSLSKTIYKRHKRAQRVRKKLRGCAKRPRLCVVKTNAHIIVQLIDDEQGLTLGSTSTFAKEFRDTEFCRRNKKSARRIGERIALIAKEKNIESVIFDRGASKYHGVIAAVADGARESGLQI
ncbi:MAG: 50S ribosomal protein L18 [Chlamydiales bacterium]|nr:50S ribosomal protein L18 [Chlamydiales bacterium]